MHHLYLQPVRQNRPSSTGQIVEHQRHCRYPSQARARVPLREELSQREEDYSDDLPTAGLLQLFCDC